MDHQNNAHGEHDEIHLPDPSIWPLAVGVATLLLGAALIFWARSSDNDFAGPMLGAAVVATLFAVFGWAYEDGRMRAKAEEGGHGATKPTRFTQVMTFAVPEGQFEAARGSGILAQLEERDNALRDLGGFQDLRIIATPGSAGPSQVLIETTWSDREGLATYEETRQTMLDLVAANPEQVLPGSVQVFDMEVIRDTKDVTFRFGKGAAFTVVAGLMVGGFMIGAGLNLFADDSEGGGSGGGETVTPPPANPFSVVMTDNKFDKTAITAGPNAEIVISATNNGASPHNIAFYDRQGGTALPGQTGTAFVKLNGGESGTNTFTTPGAGEYFFQCDFHPDTMTGTFSVVEGGPTGPGTSAPPPAGGGEEPAGGLQVIATDNKFDKTEIAAKAGETVTITLVNDGRAIHNIAFYEEKNGESLPGQEGDAFEKVAGGATGTMTFTAPAAGEYYFQCDFHPDQMFGTFVVS